MLPAVNMEFVNREAELRELDAAAKHGGLLVVYGRRRVGKTRLLRHWLAARDGFYSQAIEAQRDMQIRQVFADLRPQLDTQVGVRNLGNLGPGGVLRSNRSRGWEDVLVDKPGENYREKVEHYYDEAERLRRSAIRNGQDDDRYLEQQPFLGNRG